MLSTSGSRSQRIYDALRERIKSGSLEPGDRLPGQLQLASDYGVALMTVRQALSHLAADGLISIEHGRGMFVRRPAVAASVLIVDDEPMLRTLIGDMVEAAGFTAITAGSPAAALQAMERHPEIAMVLTDVRMPDISDGVSFIKTIRHRWPRLPLAAITAYPNDLQPLHGEPECPVLIIHKPFHISQIEEALRLAMGSRARVAAG